MSNFTDFAIPYIFIYLVVIMWLIVDLKHSNNNIDCNTPTIMPKLSESELNEKICNWSCKNWNQNLRTEKDRK